VTRKLVAVVAVVALAVGVAASPAAAESAVNGSGSTFAAIMIDQWRADVAQQFGLRVNYTANGSSAGRTQFEGGVVDWASSDIAYMPGEETPGFPFTYMPLVAGGTALMYNLRDGAGRVIDGLRLNGDIIAKIFTTEITSWRDPAILALNADNGVGDRLPDVRIRPVVRAEGSGTTAVFMQYMASVAPGTMQNLRNRYPFEYRTPDGVLWTDVFPGAGDPFNPGLNLSRANGSYALANIVANANSMGAIGYAEAGYAISAGLPVAYVANAAGNYTLPTARNVAVALLEATRNGDGTQNLSAVFTNGRPEAYAVSSYNYAIVPTAGFDPDKGATLGRYLTYAMQEGQGKAAPLGYSPIPPNLVQQGFDVIRQIPGAPDPGPLGDWGKYYLELDVGRIQRPGSGGIQGPAGSGAGGAGGAGRGGPGGTAGTTTSTAAAGASTTAGTTGDALLDELAAGDLSKGSREALKARYVLRDGKLVLLGEDGEELISLPRDRGVLVYILLALLLVAVAIVPPLVLGWIGPRRRRRREAADAAAAAEAEAEAFEAGPDGATPDESEDTGRAAVGAGP
jgi:phosphate transport system substrate-binding protein